MGCGIGDNERCVSGWPIFWLSNTVFSCFTCYEGLRHILDSLLLHAINSQSVMTGCTDLGNIQNCDRCDHYALKSCVFDEVGDLLITGRTTCRSLDINCQGSFILYFRALIPAFAICPSSWIVPPDTPIAPIILPP